MYIPKFHSTVDIVEMRQLKTENILNYLIWRENLGSLKHHMYFMNSLRFLLSCFHQNSHPGIISSLVTPF